MRRPGKPKPSCSAAGHEPGPAETLEPRSTLELQLDQLQARANEAAARIEAERAELDASHEYTARMEREAQAEPEAGRRAEAPAEIEMELQ